MISRATRCAVRPRRLPRAGALYGRLPAARPVLPPAGEPGAGRGLAARVAETRLAKSYGIAGFVAGEQEDSETSWTGFQTFAFATSTFSPGDDVDTMTGKISTRQRALDHWPRGFMQVGEATFLCQNAGAHWYTAPRLSTTWRQDWAWNVAHRDRIRWVEVITRNGWGESAAAPSSNLLMALQPVTRFCADWFKTGRAPKIAKDVVTVFHRTTPPAAVPTKYPRRINGPVPSDEVEALALLTAPATLVLRSGTTEYKQPVGAGVQSLIRPFNLGIQSARIGTGLSLVGSGGQMGDVSVSAFVTPEAAPEGGYAGVVAHASGGGSCRFALGHWGGSGSVAPVRPSSASGRGEPD